MNLADLDPRGQASQPEHARIDLSWASTLRPSQKIGFDVSKRGDD
jgi:hypothetical protein